MSELELQKYLRTKRLSTLEQEYGIVARQSEINPELYLFKYSQINSPMGERIVQESRGIILNGDNNWSIVARPYDKFFNYGEGHAPEIDWSTATCFDKLDGCFLREQTIDCWDGSLVKIGDIVNRGLRPILIGQDAKGNLVPSYITNVKNNGTKDNWLLITLEDKIQQSSTKRSNKLKVTSNHHIFIDGDYKDAGSLKIGDKLTTYEYRINNFLKEYIEGSLLGDGYINKQGGYSESHLSSLVGFIQWQKTCLGNLFTSVYNQVSGYGSNMTKVKALVNISTKELKNKWYIDGKKQVPKNLELTDLLVAKWYLDDGSRAHSIYQKDRANFATNSFTKEECELLAGKLSTKYKVSTTVFNNKGWTIRINAGRDNSIVNFWQAIAPFIPYDIEYKLPEEYRNIPKIIPAPEIVKVKKLVSILDISSIENTKANFPSGRCGYDIETSTNNYFAGGLLVHNSLITLYFYKGKWNVATSGNPDAAGEVWNESGKKITFADLFWQTWNKLGYKVPTADGGESRFAYSHGELEYKYWEGVSFMFELMTPYNKVVVQHKEAKLVLHGARNIDSGHELYIKPITTKFGWEACCTFPLYTIEDVLASANYINPVDNEGYVVMDIKFNRIKVKSPQYVALHHMRDTLSPRRMLEIVATNESEEFLNYFEEFRDLHNEIKDKYLKLVDLITEAVNRARLFNEDWKAIGLFTKGQFYQGTVFQVLRNNISVKDALSKMPTKKLETWLFFV